MDLKDLRQAIDGIDDAIHDLLMQRAELVLQVGHVKGRTLDAPFYRPEREAQIHTRLGQRHQGPLPVAAVHRIFREIISASLSLEKQLVVAYLGPEATHTHQATLKHFGSSCRMAPCRSMEELFQEVEVGRADYGVVPVEHSTEGMEYHTLDCFVDSPLRICAEIVLPVSYNLLTNATSLEEVTVIYGHFQALADCHNWLDKNISSIPRRTTESTAQALEEAHRQPNAAAIGGVYAADTYGLAIMAEHIEDQGNDENRFLVVGRHEPAPSGLDKTSLMFSLQDHPGFLYQILGIFAQRGINLSRLESRPSRRRPWDYLFFVDLQGHQGDDNIRPALQELARIPGVFTKILGSYPHHVL
ncbi:MAG: prephenate dehydratase [Magnetococcales bacterium]|nr:prephenate dehydratase [Magnetococcales bacterium]